jgi:hypothetical protein
LRNVPQMHKSITFTEELIPKLKNESSFDTTPAYLNYLSDTIEQSIKSTEGIVYLTDKNVSPMYQIRKIFNENKPLSLEDIKEIKHHVVNIQKIKNSFYQRETTAEKLNLFLCWSLYEQGVSWSKIYEMSDENCAWNSHDKDDVIRIMKRYSKKFQWRRKLKKLP